jgi:ribonuclease P protein component
MTPPEAPVQGQEGSAAVMPPAVPVLSVLRKRADFLRASRARRQGTAGFLLQARRRDASEGIDSSTLRIGYTCSKKLGNAVMRNRAKRRLRAIARDVLPGHGRPGWDYVLVGRPDATVARDYTAMRADLLRALDKIHAGAD